MDKPATTATTASPFDASMYAMPAFWTLTVVDLEETVRWYTGCLGFIELFRMPARPGSAELAHLRRRRYQDILVTCGRPESPGPWLTLAATTEELLEAASAVMVSGVGAVHPPVATAWNTVDLHLSDPDGHRLSLTAPQDEHSQDRDADVDTVMLPAATGQQALPGQRPTVTCVGCGLVSADQQLPRPNGYHATGECFSEYGTLLAVTCTGGRHRLYQLVADGHAVLEVLAVFRPDTTMAAEMATSRRVRTTSSSSPPARRGPRHRVARLAHRGCRPAARHLLRRLCHRVGCRAAADVPRPRP